MSRISVTFHFDEEQRRLLNRIRADLRDDEAVQASLADVTDHTAVRYLVYGVMRSMLDEEREGGETENILPFRGKPRLVGAEGGSGTEEGGKNGGNDPQEGAEKADEADTFDLEPEILRAPAEYADKNGFYLREPLHVYQDQAPDAEWDPLWGAIEAYYAENGWIRAMSPTESGIPQEYFWCPDPNRQDLPPFAGRDPGGRRIVGLMEVSLGHYHPVPRGWGSVAGDSVPADFGNVGTWQPGG